MQSYFTTILESRAYSRGLDLPNRLGCKVGKVYEVGDDGGLATVQSKYYASTFSAVRERLTLQQYADRLDKLTSYECLISGDYPEEKVKVCGDSALTDARKAQGWKTRSSKDCFFLDIPGFMVFDVDHLPAGVESLEDVLAVMRDIFPALRDCGMVIRRSASNGILDSAGNYVKPPKKWHIHIPVTSKALIGSTLDIAFERLVAAGYGVGLITRGDTPSVQLRSLVDTALIKPLQPIYESNPELPDGFTRAPFETIVIDGPAIDCEKAFPPLTAAEMGAFAKAKSQIKADLEPERQARRVAAGKKLKAKHNWTDEQLANHYARTEEGVISWDFPIGVVVEGELVSMPLREAVEKHPGNYCLHPFEPEYGGTDKSKICKHGLGVFSYAHGENKLYRGVEPTFHCKETAEKYWAVESPKRKNRMLIAEGLKGDELVKWAYLIAKNDALHRFDVDLPRPAVWFGSVPAFKNLTYGEIDLLSAHFEKLLDERKTAANKPLKLSKCELFLRRDESNRINWAMAHKKSQNEKLIGVRCAHGGGKTSVFARMFTENKTGVLCAMHRRSLVAQACSVLRLDHYQEAPINWVHGRLGTCINSLCNIIAQSFIRRGVKTLIIDEAGQLRRALTSITERQNDIFNELKRICVEAEKIVLLDADLSDVDVRFYEGLAKCSMFVIDAEESKAQPVVRINCVNRLAQLDGIVAHLKAGQCGVASYSSAELAQKHYRKVKEQFPDKNIVLLASTSDRIENEDFEKAKDNPNEYFADVDFVFHSSLIGTGFSVELPRFTKAWQFVAIKPLSPADCFQSLRRFRAIQDFHIYMKDVGGAPKEIKHKTRHPKGLEGLKSIVESERIHGEAYFGTAYAELLRQRGFDVIGCGVEAQRDALDKFEDEECEAVAAAVPLDPKEAEKVFGAYREIFYRCVAYRVRKAFNVDMGGVITADDVKLYRDYQRELRRFKTAVFDREGLGPELIGKLCQRKMKKSDCEKILAFARKHFMALKVLKLLPDRWLARGVPKHRPRDAVGTWLDFFGLANEQGGNKNDRDVLVSPGLWLERWYGNLNNKPDCIPAVFMGDELDGKELAVKMLEQGATKKAIVEATGLSLPTVKRLHRKLKADAEKLKAELELQGVEALAEKLDAVKGQGIFADWPAFTYTDADRAVILSEFTAG